MRRCLCLVFPPPSRLRQCLSLRPSGGRGSRRTSRRPSRSLPFLDLSLPSSLPFLDISLTFSPPLQAASGSKPFIVAMAHGSPLISPWAFETADAVLNIGYGGQVKRPTISHESCNCKAVLSILDGHLAASLVFTGGGIRSGGRAAKRAGGPERQADGDVLQARAAWQHRGLQHDCQPRAARQNLQISDVRAALSLRIRALLHRIDSHNLLHMFHHFLACVLAFSRLIAKCGHFRTSATPTSSSAQRRQPTRAPRWW